MGMNNIASITTSSTVQSITKHWDVMKKNSYLLLMTEFHLPEHIIMDQLSVTAKAWFRSTKTYVVDHYEYTFTDRREQERKRRRMEEEEQEAIIIVRQQQQEAAAAACEKAELLAVAE